MVKPSRRFLNNLRLLSMLHFQFNQSQTDTTSTIGQTRSSAFVFQFYPWVNVSRKSEKRKRNEDTTKKWSKGTVDSFCIPVVGKQGEMKKHKIYSNIQWENPSWCLPFYEALSCIFISRIVHKRKKIHPQLNSQRN